MKACDSLDHNTINLIKYYEAVEQMKQLIF